MEWKIPLIKQIRTYRIHIHELLIGDFDVVLSGGEITNPAIYFVFNDLNRNSKSLSGSLCFNQ